MRVPSSGFRPTVPCRRRHDRSHVQPHPRRRPGPRGALLTLVAGLALVGAACGGGADQPGTAQAVRPFSEVQEGDLTFEADPSDPRRGIFRVTTTEPMICAIVWGEDESLGRFNNSLAMNGTGIEQHDVVLPDVEPGREYRFLVQGTNADGTLYRSELSTFTIEGGGGPAAAPPDVEVGEELSLGATVLEASSSFSESFGAANAVDGDDATEWSTRGDGDSGFITLDLGRQAQIGAVEFVTRSMADGSAITDTFTVSVDGGPPLGPFPAGTPARRRIAELAATGRELRFDVETSTGGNVGAIEVRVYAPA